jgi:hypothetical protein
MVAQHFNGSAGIVADRSPELPHPEALASIIDGLLCAWPHICGLLGDQEVNEILEGRTKPSPADR